MKFSATVMAPIRPSRIRSSGTWATPRSETWRGDAEVVVWPSMTISPESADRRPDDRLDELGLAVALDAGERDDLARPDLEADALDGHVVAVVAHVEVRDREHHVARRRRALDDLELHVPADHEVREDLAGRVLGLHRAGDASAAQHRDPVRDLQHLVELVGDEDDGGAGLGQAADDPEQLLRLEGRQDGGRLVQHEDVALAVERLEDLHPLAHADGEVLDLARPG